ncbi:glycoside hydrolase family 2 protein [Eisenbergiella porci]|uniref:glycoside hydrolase family 2 protein n=1 Tax=Eisenbergiella TaxID=1432051 RepID=UPI003A933563
MSSRAGNRIQRLENNDWKFMHGDFPEAETPDFDDSQWYDIGLPHSFGIPYFMTNEFYVGYGCYRKKLYVEKEWLGKRISLEFQGSFQDTQVYVNGCLAGSHKGGYTAFIVDITSCVHEGENQLFIRVNNLWNPRLAPRAGEHVFNGGIYRDVSLIVTQPLHIAWYGTRVTTPEVSKGTAKIAMDTEICNEAENAAQCRLVSRILREGEEIGRVCSALNVSSGDTEIVSQEYTLCRPELWHPDHPNLYVLKSEIWEGERLTDSCETEFGIRWFSFSADTGFSLNGEHYEIHGANVHQDHAGWSDAVTHTGIQRDIAMIKGCGMNFIRGSHYPHHTYFAQECDRQGILFWSENCFWGTGGPKEEGYWTASGYPVKEEDEEEFEQSCLQTLEEMIRTNRNHPSIIVWSMCNEPFFSDIEVMEKAKALVVRLAELSHRLDPTRPAAVGGAQRGGFDCLGDIAGYNGDGASIFINPGFPNFVSEYGSTVSDRPGEFMHRYQDGVEKNYPWRSGKALWCGFHHGSILFDMGHMGMIDYYRLPLNTWYWYRENLLGIQRPALLQEGIPFRIHLAADRTEISSDGTQDAHIIVSVMDEQGNRITNSPEVVLEVVSGEGMFPTGKTFVFSPERNNFIEGLGAIELRSYYGGDTIIQARSGGLLGDRLCIHVTGSVKPENRQLKELQPPPYLQGAPERKQLSNISLNRPVFCSSAHKEHPGKNVTDGSFNTFWYPAEEETGGWILVDLEGTKEVKSITLEFNAVMNGVYELALSDDRKEFRQIYLAREGDANSFLTVHLSSERTRFVRVRFPGEAVGIVKIEVMA